MNKDQKINNTDKDNQNEPTSTTGHDWDGISEYDIPAPRWWLTVWVICIIWAVIYWFFYPAWPIKNGNSKGLLNWSTKSELLVKQNIANVEKSKYVEQIDSMSFNEIKNNPQLMEFALNGGKASFKENCAGCHGTGAQGAKGYPNLNDDDWLWGGKIEDIYTTLLYGIRSGHEKARVNQMPYFGKDKILLKIIIPRNLLKEGTYHLEFISGIHNIKWLIKDSISISIKVVNSHGLNSEYNDFRPGDIIPFVKYSLND